MEKRLRKKYRKELAHFKEKGQSFQEQWLTLLKDLANESESRWDFLSVRYETVMTKTDWKKFKDHPQRKPYRSKIKTLPAKYEGKFSFILQVLKDSYSYIKKLKNSPNFKRKLQNSTAVLLDCALNAKFFPLAIYDHDAYFGRSRRDRNNGKVKPTAVSLAKLNYALKEYAQLNKKDFQKLKKKINKVSKGRLDILSEFYSTCQIEESFKRDILEIFKIMRRDQTLSFARIQRAWQAWQEVSQIGLNLNFYLKLNGLPTYSETKRKLVQFLENPLYNEEILQHLKDDLPKTYRKYLETKKISVFDIFTEEAERKKYPKKIREQEAIEKMVKNSWKKVVRHFPLMEKSSPRNLLLNPTHPASTSRAFQSSTRNNKGKQVNVIVMTPRSSLENDYLPTLAHEITHTIHKTILEKGEQAKLLSKGSSERVTHNILEEFSQLAQEQFEKNQKLPYKKSYLGKEFPNFRSAYGIRFQAPFSLVQLETRKEFDKLIKKGVKGKLEEEKLWLLKKTLDQKLQEWFSLGINFSPEDLTAFDLVKPSSPTDGLRYLRKYLISSKQVGTEKKNGKANSADKSLKTAFFEKFGPEWIKTKKGRVFFLWLLLETGRNQEIENYPKLVKEKSFEECYRELKQINLKDKEI